MLKKHYSNNYRDRMIFCDEKYVDLTSSDFEKLFNITIEYAKRQIEFIDDIISLDMGTSIFSKQMRLLLEKCVEQMEFDFNEPYTHDILFELHLNEE